MKVKKVNRSYKVQNRISVIALNTNECNNVAEFYSLLMKIDSRVKLAQKKNKKVKSKGKIGKWARDIASLVLFDNCFTMVHISLSTQW